MSDTTRAPQLSPRSGGNSNSPATPESELKQVIANQFNDGGETAAVHLSAAALAGVATSSFTNAIWVVRTHIWSLYWNVFRRFSTRVAFAAFGKGLVQPTLDNI